MPEAAPGGGGVACHAEREAVHDVAGAVVEVASRARRFAGLQAQDEARTSRPGADRGGVVRVDGGAFMAA